MRHANSFLSDSFDIHLENLHFWKGFLFNLMLAAPYYAFSWRIHFLNRCEVSLEKPATFEKPHLSRTQATLLDSIFPQSFTQFSGFIEFKVGCSLSNVKCCPICECTFPKKNLRCEWTRACNNKKQHELRDTAHKLESFLEEKPF